VLRARVPNLLDGAIAGSCVTMGCGASKGVGAEVNLIGVGPEAARLEALKSGDADAAAQDQNNAYKASYAPANDDPEGKPLSALIACPCISSMYNGGNFPSLDALVADAEAEEFTGWDSSPAHEALYASTIELDAFRDALLNVNVTDAVAQKLAEGFRKSEPPSIFQCNCAGNKHGEATRIRYDHVTQTGGYSQTRFDK